MHARTNPFECPVCAGPAKIAHHLEDGYQKGMSFDVFHCQYCGLSYTDHVGSSAKLYDLIYRYGCRVPGYDRYHRYAETVRNVQDPLKYLADSEESYWAVARYLHSRHRTGKKKPRVIDLGCGLGYLTYALVQNGFDAIGLDISPEAVDSARNRFGEFYFCETLDSFLRRSKQPYDTILCIQMIEHIADAPSFLSGILSSLPQDGEILIATPNKSFYPPGTVWFTDLPPVHLYWYTEAAMSALADRLNCHIAFTDFSDFNSEHNVTISSLSPRYFKTPSPFFDKNCNLIALLPKESLCCRLQRRSVRELHALTHLCGLQPLGRNGIRHLGSRGRDICAVLSKSH